MTLFDWDEMNGKNVLDIGCNTGMLSLEAGRHGAFVVAGVDVNREAIEIARDQRDKEGLEQVHFLCQDIESRAYREVLRGMFLRRKPDIVFFCAVTIQTKMPRLVLQWLSGMTKETLYFETNRIHPDNGDWPLEKYLEMLEASTEFSRYEWRPCRENRPYYFFKCLK
jgi:SAM-dependent methyltransferase